jgi:hypothetical protein
MYYRLQFTVYSKGQALVYYDRYNSLVCMNFYGASISYCRNLQMILSTVVPYVRNLKLTLTLTVKKDSERAARRTEKLK